MAGTGTIGLRPAMTDYIEAWQCIGCGKIEAPQTCIGVCKDRKVFFVGKGEHDRLQQEADALRQQLEQAQRLLLHLSRTTPHEGQHLQCWLGFQQQARALLGHEADASDR